MQNEHAMEFNQTSFLATTSPSTIHEWSAQDVLMSLYLFLMIFLNHTPFVFIPNFFYILLATLFISRLITNREQLRINAIVFLFGMILIGSLLPVITGKAANMQLAISHVIRSFQLLSLLIILLSYLTNRFRLAIVLTSVASGFIAAFVIGVIILRLSIGERFIGLYSNANMAGFWSINTLIVCGLLLHRETIPDRSKYFSLFLIPSFICATALIWLSQSRKALLALFFILLVTLLGLFLRSKLRVILLFLSTTLFLISNALVSTVSENSILSRFAAILPQSVGVASEDQSVNDRLEFYKAGLRMIQDNPIIGYGGDAFPSIGYRYSTTFRVGRDLHSAVLNTYLESGVIGFISYLTIYAILIITFIRKMRTTRLFSFLLLSVITILFIQLGESLYLDKYLWLLIIVFSYYIHLVNRQHEVFA